MKKYKRLVIVSAILVLVLIIILTIDVILCLHKCYLCLKHNTLKYKLITLKSTKL